METNLLEKKDRICIFKITDLDDNNADVFYYTFNQLKEYVLELYDIWKEGVELVEGGSVDISKEEIENDDTKVFEFLDSFNFGYEVIATVTLKDFENL